MIPEFHLPPNGLLFAQLSLPEISLGWALVIYVVMTGGFGAWKNIRDKETDTQRSNEIERNALGKISRDNETVEVMRKTVDTQSKVIDQQAATIHALTEENERLRNEKAHADRRTEADAD